MPLKQKSMDKSFVMHLIPKRILIRIIYLFVCRFSFYFQVLLIQRIKLFFSFLLKGIELNLIDEPNKIKWKDFMEIFNDEQTKHFLHLKRTSGRKFHSSQ
jgi:hypothetical protein